MDVGEKRTTTPTKHASNTTNQLAALPRSNYKPWEIRSAPLSCDQADEQMMSLTTCHGLDQERERGREREREGEVYIREKEMVMTSDCLPGQ